MRKLIICLLAIMVIAPVVHAGIPIGSKYQDAWHTEVWSNDGEETVSGVSVQGQGRVGSSDSDLNRLMVESNYPALGHYDFPNGWWVDHAEVALDLTSVTQVNTTALPGVHAWVIVQDDASSAGGLWINDWDDPIRHDLGLIIPVGVSTPGIYTLDATAALDEMVQNYTHWHMVVVFAVEGDVLGQSASASASILGLDESVMYNFNQNWGAPVAAGIYGEMVPEPSIMAMGLVALLALRRKKR